LEGASRLRRMPFFCRIDGHRPESGDRRVRLRSIGPIRKAAEERLILAHPAVVHARFLVFTDRTGLMLKGVDLIRSPSRRRTTGSCALLPFTGASLHRSNPRIAVEPEARRRAKSLR